MPSTTESEREEALSRLSKDYFEGYAALYPEELTALGYHSRDDQLHDPSPEATEASTFFFRTILDRASKLGAERSGAGWNTPPAYETLSRFHLHRIEELRAQVSNLEMSVYPYKLIRHQIARTTDVAGWANIASRIEKLPAYLEGLEQTFSLARASDRGPHRRVGEHITTVEIPETVKSLAAMQLRAEATLPTLDRSLRRRLLHAGEIAAVAYGRHARFVRDRLLPKATEQISIGSDEVAFQLMHVFGITRSSNDLLEEAMDALEAAKRGMVVCASKLSSDISSTYSDSSFAGANRLLGTLEETRFGEGTHVIARYTALVEKAQRFVRDHKIFYLTPEDALLRVEAMPLEVPSRSHVQNWPTPVFERGGRPRFLVRLDPSLHSSVAAPLLAVREGIPGKGLQSGPWEWSFAQSWYDPLSFMMTIDDVARAHCYFGGMSSINGHAAYAEELMRVEGFHEGAEELHASSVRVFRAVQMIVELGLHAGGMTVIKAVQLMVEHTWLRTEEAMSRVLDSARAPMRALTYLMGALEIERHKREQRKCLGSSFDECDFHEALMSWGPLSPAVIPGGRDFNRRIMHSPG